MYTGGLVYIYTCIAIIYRLYWDTVWDATTRYCHIDAMVTALRSVHVYSIIFNMYFSIKYTA